MSTRQKIVSDDQLSSQADRVTNDVVIKVVLAVPMRQVFDYLPGEDGAIPCAGCRVSVSFGHRKMIGLVIGVSNTSDYDRSKLKRVLHIIDEQPLLDADLLEFLGWISEYYLHPPGEVIFAVLPALLRKGKSATLEEKSSWTITDKGRARLQLGEGRAKVQYKILQLLEDASRPLDDDTLKGVSSSWKKALLSLQQNELVHEEQTRHVVQDVIAEQPPEPTRDQEAAIDRICQSIGGFASFLLFGITGSGKTEVYLRCIEQVLASSGQALVLVPEISLTPQLVGRFRKRFNVEIDVMHSAMTDRQRLHAWERARRGDASIIIGTRSAVFVPMARPGIIIIDEEHDSSFKQQDGFRYHARDVAIKRASMLSVPVVMGSATPSLETWYNAITGRYSLLSLAERATDAGLPVVHILDLNKLPVENGISMPLRDAVRQSRERGEQSLLFLNRRGFSPAVCCADCNHLVQCKRCDARMTWHKNEGRLICHHCGHTRRWPDECPNCHGHELVSLGQGTENIHQTIKEMVPDAEVERIDRDTTRRKGELEIRLDRAHSGETDILVGTQMLSKGHDFPNLTLVGIIDSDHLLFSADFRASERLFQLITQVSGRAGRAEKPGIVLLQTRFPDSPWLRVIANHDYRAFAEMALGERQAAEYPPFAHIALLRAESTTKSEAMNFLQHMHQQAGQLIQQQPAMNTVMLSDPMPSMMEKRAGRYRAQLLVQAPERSPLHTFLKQWRTLIEADQSARRVRWSLDVDPADLY
jgi:primosomal protein N' (replication factor Y)